MPRELTPPSNPRTRDGRLPLGTMIGWSVASICTLLVMVFLTMTLGMSGAQGITSPYLAVLQWVVMALIPSAVVGPVLAFAAWALRRRRLTWWALTLPYPLMALAFLTSLIPAF